MESIQSVIKLSKIFEEVLKCPSSLQYIMSGADVESDGINKWLKNNHHTTLCMNAIKLIDHNYKFVNNL